MSIVFSIIAVLNIVLSFVAVLLDDIGQARFCLLMAVGLAILATDKEGNG